jgi:pilus assembly protein CpaC
MSRVLLTGAILAVVTPAFAPSQTGAAPNSEEKAPASGARHAKVQKVQVDVVLVVVDLAKMRALKVDLARFAAHPLGGGTPAGGTETIPLSDVDAPAGPQASSDTQAGEKQAITVAAHLPSRTPFGLIEDSKAFLKTLGDLRGKGITKLLSQHKVVTETGKPGTSVEAVKATKRAKASAITCVRVLPIALGNGMIHLEVGGEIHDDVWNMRSTRCALRLKNGDSFCMGGLIQTKTSSVVTAVPVLGNLPFIGSVFRKTASVETEEECLALVTVHLLDP